MATFDIFSLRPSKKLQGQLWFQVTQGEECLVQSHVRSGSSTIDTWLVYQNKKFIRCCQHHQRTVNGHQGSETQWLWQQPAGLLCRRAKLGHVWEYVIPIPFAQAVWVVDEHAPIMAWLLPQIELDMDLTCFFLLGMRHLCQGQIAAASGAEEMIAQLSIDPTCNQQALSFKTLSQYTSKQVDSSFMTDVDGQICAWLGPDQQLAMVPSATPAEIPAPHFDTWLACPEITLTAQQSDGGQPVCFYSSDGSRLSGVIDTCPSLTLGTVVLLHGSGPENRNSGSGPEGRDYERSSVVMFVDLASRLAAKGLQVLRYDKRGVGQSEGQWEQVTRRHLVADAVAAVHYLQSHAPDYPCFVMGTSEGANVAISVASQCPKLAGIVLMGCPADPIDQLMVAKLQQRALIDRQNAGYWQSQAEYFQRFFHGLHSLRDTIRNSSSDVMSHGYNVKWWLELMEFDPKQEVAHLKLPVLVLHGVKDVEVPVEQASKLEDALRCFGIVYEGRRYRGLNHFFTPAVGDIPGQEYDIPLSVPSEVVDDVINWIKKLKTS